MLSTIASEQSMRWTSCSFAISRLKMPTGTPPRRAAFTAMFKQSAVFPIDGRPAIMMKSPGWSPEVLSSRGAKPVATPVIRSPAACRFSNISIAFRSTSLSATK